MIFDCFPFYNELDLLELRLRELDGYVDKHVLIESPTTHSGKPKPLYYADNKERFAPWRDKIIHVVATLPSPMRGVKKPRWVRENAQRDALLLGLERADARPDDVVLVSDADELPRGEKVQEFVRHVGNGEPSGGLLWFFYYYLNGYRDYAWRSLIGLSVEACKMKSPTDWRVAYMKRKRKMRAVERAGWHFSFLGGVEVVRDKFGAYAHAEFDRRQFKSRLVISKRIECGIDPVGRKGISVTYIPLNSTFPKPVLERPWAYAHLIRGHDVNASVYG